MCEFGVNVKSVNTYKISHFKDYTLGLSTFVLIVLTCVPLPVYAQEHQREPEYFNRDHLLSI